MRIANKQDAEKAITLCQRVIVRAGEELLSYILTQCLAAGGKYCRYLVRSRPEIEEAYGEDGEIERFVARYEVAWYTLPRTEEAERVAEQPLVDVWRVSFMVDGRTPPIFSRSSQ